MKKKRKKKKIGKKREREGKGKGGYKWKRMEGKRWKRSGEKGYIVLSSLLVIKLIIK